MCDVLHASDVYLLPGLKRRCAARMTQVLDTDSVMTLIRMARLYNLPRLEDQCAEFIATNIEKVLIYFSLSHSVPLLLKSFH